MFDRDLAQLYNVPIHRLNEAVKRNIKRFPLEFMFQLTDDEWKIKDRILRSLTKIPENINLTFLLNMVF